MVELRLRGGLGNQMSQVAFSYLLAIKRNDKLCIDVSSYHNYTIRECSIQKMKLNDRIFFMDGANSLSYRYRRLCQEKYHLERYIGKKMGKGQFGKDVFIKHVKRGHYYNFDSDYYGYPQSSHKDVDVYGYFLATEYFQDEIDEIQKAFEVKREHIGERARKYEGLIGESKNPIAISLRLQDDYVLNKNLYVCKPEYYVRAKEIMDIMNPDADYFIFADDISRAKELRLELFKKTIFLEGISDVEGMHLMCKCKNFIIANSSFSWWGAYLSRNKDKVIIAPERWMNSNADYRDKYYSNMLTISV